MVPGEQDGWDARFGKTHNPATPLSLKRRRRRAVFIGISSEDHQVCLLVDCSLNDCIQAAQKVHHPLRETCLGVMGTKIGHVYMGIGKMEQLDHQHIIMESAQAMLELV